MAGRGRQVIQSATRSGASRLWGQARPVFYGFGWCLELSIPDLQSAVRFKEIENDDLRTHLVWAINKLPRGSGRRWTFPGARTVRSGRSFVTCLPENLLQRDLSRQVTGAYRKELYCR